MAVLLQSATRVNPAPCSHFDVTLNVDGSLEHVNVSADELLAPITQEEKQSFLRLWARYHRAKGKTLAQMVGQTVIGDIV